jgi:hypothetical protein
MDDSSLRPGRWTSKARPGGCRTLGWISGTTRPGSGRSGVILEPGRRIAELAKGFGRTLTANQASPSARISKADGIKLILASAFSNQKGMLISRYISLAAVKYSWDCSRLSMRR